MPEKAVWGFAIGQPRALGRELVCRGWVPGCPRAQAPRGRVDHRAVGAPVRPVAARSGGGRPAWRIARLPDRAAEPSPGLPWRKASAREGIRCRPSRPEADHRSCLPTRVRRGRDPVCAPGREAPRGASACPRASLPVVTIWRAPGSPSGRGSLHRGQGTTSVAGVGKLAAHSFRQSAATRPASISR